MEEMATGGQKGVDWGVMAVQQTGLDEEKL